MSDYKLEIFRLNKFGCKIEKPDLSKMQIPDSARKFCGPFVHSSNLGWWLYPPLDMDISYGNNQWKYKILSEYPADEVEVLTRAAKKFGSKAIRQDGDNWRIGEYDLPKNKYSFGNVEKDVAQFWTGLCFRTSPGLSLLISNLLNVFQDIPYSIQSGILETSWLRADHWINFKFVKPFAFTQIRRDKPVAQIIPLGVDYNNIDLIDNLDISQDEQAFREWDLHYSMKFTQKDDNGKYFKDSSTYHKLRKQNKSKCPFSHDS